ncbi:MAG: hypothetical protein M1816_002971 [Peltula sp. TS41687]|nr:MAG: hypothetical protein M1816_002971 [Peltula sp. TS41687]
MELPNPPPTQEVVETPSDASQRSRDSRNGLKRSDPFQFGSRYLLPSDDPFEFNAWDHVDTDEDYKAHAEEQYRKQRSSPVSEFDKKRFNTDPSRWWNLFYKNNTTHFFKDRQWLHQEFPVLTQLTAADAGPTTLLEVGAGAGNTLWPILAANKNPRLKIHACDFSPRAIELIRADARFRPETVETHVWDVSNNNNSADSSGVSDASSRDSAAPSSASADSLALPDGIEPGSVDVVMLIFIFSALAPEQWAAAVRNVYRVLKPGGQVLLRDYARGDMAQVRFRKGRWLEEGFYVRGDGTRVYFFEPEEVRRVWGGGEMFEVVDLEVDRRLLVNRLRRLKMYRCWIQGRFVRRSGGREEEEKTELHGDTHGEKSRDISRSRSNSASKKSQEEMIDRLESMNIEA